MINPDPTGAAVRAARRLRKHGDNPACVVCGETDLTMLEEDHTAGRAHDRNLMSALCRNHHAAVTEDRRDVGIPTRYAVGYEVTPLDRLSALLAGLAVQLVRLAAWMLAYARWLSEFVAAMDRQHDGWRDTMASLPAVRLHVPDVTL